MTIAEMYIIAVTGKMAICKIRSDNHRLLWRYRYDPSNIDSHDLMIRERDTFLKTDNIQIIDVK